MLRKFAALFTALLIIATLLPPISHAALPRTLRLRFYVRGKGHGVGMSMAGVYGMATHGKNYRQIIGHYYPNTAWGYKSDSTIIRVRCEDRVIRRISVRGYLYRLAEEPDSWPREGLRSLMVAARSYLWYKVNTYGYMPGGQYFLYSINPSTRPHIVAAVKATSGKIRTYNGKAIIAAYSSSAGGYTAAFHDTWPGGSTYPYLVRRYSPYDRYIRSTYSFSRVKTIAQLQSKFPSVGRINNIRITSRNHFGTWGGRVLNIRLYGSKATKNYHGWTFAQTMGLNSGLFTISSFRTKTSIHSSDYSITKGQAVMIYGYVYPGHRGRKVKVTITYPGRVWYKTPTLYGSSSRRSKYSFMWRPGRRGQYRLSTRFSGDTYHLPSRSRTIVVRVY